MRAALEILWCVPLLSALPASAALAEQVRPVLRSNSRVITIIDGEHVKRDYWALMPEKNPDVYHVEIPRKPHTVTFRSDVDEISFPVAFGDRIDFVVLLGGTTECATQIRAEYKSLHPFSRDALAADSTIPFWLGDNDKIYIKGRLNRSEELRFQFDLGCGGCIIKKSSVGLANMRFDGTITLTNSDGVNEVPSSSANHLEIAGLQWADLPFAVADNMTHREDGLLGNSLFQDKVVEIDYDRSVILVHDAPPVIDPSYSRHPIFLDGVAPFVRGTLAIGESQREGWFMLDTGAYTSILNSDRAGPWHKLALELRRMVPWRADSAGPRISIGEHAFDEFNYTVRKGGQDASHLGLLGNDILKRFNVILDTQNGFVYLRPNGLADDAFVNPEYYLARGIALAAVLGTAVCGWFTIQRALRQRRRKTAPKRAV
jgi:hypothetical protein